MRRDDDDSSSSSSSFGRFFNNADDDKPRSRFGFNTSFSTSGSVSASTKSSLTETDLSSPNHPQTQTTSAMAGPFDLEFWWPVHSPSALALSANYSPLNLRSLPQPVPSDAPPNVDMSIFTFEDAFEDLLAVSQGHPLPDISARYQQRQLLRSMFPEGEPAFFWLRRLNSQGLLDLPDPNNLSKFAESSWDNFHRELDRRAANVWRAVSGEDNRNSRDVYEDAATFPESFRDKSESDHLHHRRREPDHFDDFFSSVRSSFSESQSSWDTFVKSFHDSPLDKPEPQEFSKNQEVTKDEYVDRFGYLHSKVTVKTLDDDGNQIGSQTHYTVRPADKQEDKQGGQSNSDDKSGLHASGKVETKTGWFWK